MDIDSDGQIINLKHKIIEDEFTQILTKFLKLCHFHSFIFSKFLSFNNIKVNYVKLDSDI